MTEKIHIVDHIVERVKSHNVLSCSPYSWLTGAGYLYSLPDEGWNVYYNRDGLFNKKMIVRLKRFDTVTETYRDIPLTQSQKEVLWDLQEYFDAILKVRSEQADIENQKVIERLKWWP